MPSGLFHNLHPGQKRVLVLVRFFCPTNSPQNFIFFGVSPASLGADSESRFFGLFVGMDCGGGMTDLAEPMPIEFKMSSSRSDISASCSNWELIALQSTKC
jgi:hypothetical protein